MKLLGTSNEVLRIINRSEIFRFVGTELFRLKVGNSDFSKTWETHRNKSLYWLFSVIAPWKICAFDCNTRYHK